MASAVGKGPGAVRVSRMLLWSALHFCFSFHFQTEMGVSGSGFTVCARLQYSTKTFHLRTGESSCTIQLTLSEKEVNVHIGGNVTNHEKIITRSPLSSFCFTWSENIKNYTISPQNILNVTGSPSDMSVYSMCDNFTITNITNSNCFFGNFSYMKNFNLNSIVELKKCNLIFIGSNTSVNVPIIDECNEMARSIMNSPTTKASYIPQFLMLMLSNIVDRCEDLISNISFSRLPYFVNKVTRKITNILDTRQVIINKNIITLIMLFAYQKFDGVSIEANTSLITFNQSDTVNNPTIEVTINKDVDDQIQDKFNIVSTLYKGTGFFQDENGSSVLNDLVVDITVGVASIQLRDIINITFHHLNQMGNQNHLCVFWEFGPTDSGVQGKWNDSGCTTHISNYATQCTCDHLSFFAVLLNVGHKSSPPLDPIVAISLQYITLIGCTISAMFLAITIIHFIYLSLQRQIDSFNKIHLNLCISLLFLNIDFMLSEELSSFHIDWLCKALAISLHYFLLSSFLWMGVEGFHLYLLIIKVFNTEIRWYLLKASFIAWGFPVVVVGVSFAVDQETYGYFNTSIEEQPNSVICWITKDLVQYITNFGTFALIFLGNAVVLMVTMVKVLQLKRVDAQHKQKPSNCKSLCSLLSLSVLLGGTYGLAFFQFGNGQVFVLILFTILNSLQGFFIFLWQFFLTIQARKSKMQNSSTS